MGILSFLGIFLASCAPQLVFEVTDERGEFWLFSHDEAAMMIFYNDAEDVGVFIGGAERVEVIADFEAVLSCDNVAHGVGCSFERVPACEWVDFEIEGQLPYSGSVSWYERDSFALRPYQMFLREFEAEIVLGEPREEQLQEIAQEIEGQEGYPCP